MKTDHKKRKGKAYRSKPMPEDVREKLREKLRDHNRKTGKQTAIINTYLARFKKRK